MDEKIGIGVIGISFGQYVHVPAFRADPRCEVRAICASTLDRAQAAAQNLQIPKAFGDARELIADPEIDAVSIAVPPFLQPGLIQCAAAAGKHLFCEKPVANAAKDVGDGIKAVRESGVVHAVDFIFPEIPAWREARKLLQSRELGSLRHVAISWQVETRAYQTQKPIDNWKTRAHQGGGTLLNLVSHSAYYIEWLFGPVLCLNCKLRKPAGSAVDSGVNAWLSMANGSLVTLNVSADSFMGSGHRIEAYGETGSMILRNESADYVNGFELLVGQRRDRQMTQRAAPIVSKSDGRADSAAKIVRRFIDAILSKTSVTPNLEHGLRAQNLLDAMRTADTLGQWVDV